MTNPKDTKFPHIQVSPLQGLVNYCETQTKLHVIGRNLDSISERIEQKKQKAKKSLLDLCELITMDLDDEQGEIEIAYRFGHAPKSQQTDVCENQYIIERVVSKETGEELTLNDRQYQTVIEEIMTIEAKNLVR